MSCLHPRRLACEYLTNPLGLDIPLPRLSWQFASEARGAAQSAWEVAVASAPGRIGQPDVWASGRVEGGDSVQVPYGGPPLRSRQRCWWRVRAWDQQGEVSEWSETHFWEMGLLAPADWRGQWVGSPLVGSPAAAVPCPYLRRVFQVEKPVRAARLYATALGLYEFVLNGERVGEDALTPGWTDYQKRLLYQTYDVTALLRPGANVAGAVLGDGWWCGRVCWQGRQNYGERPALLAQLALDYEDGTTEWIVTDGQWTHAFGPTLSADLLMGEVCDARRELADWQDPAAPAAGWQPVVTAAPPPGAALASSNTLSVRRHEEIAPVSVTRPGANHWLYDLGQNFAGRVRLRAAGPAGATLTLRHAEMLDAEGALYTQNLRSAAATDAYTLRGGGEEEIWEPRFTFHGFRYVEVKSTAPLAGDPGLTGVVLHSPLPPTGSFECSDPLVNQLQHNIWWGQKSNFLEAPTDCPQRDERLGWTGDAQVFIRTAAFNAQVAPFFTKWQRDVDDAQMASGAVPAVVPNLGLGNSADGAGVDGGPAWADAAVICPWTVYQCYGDRRLLEQHYPRLAAFGDYLHATSREGVRCGEGAAYWKGFGDWLAWDGTAGDEGGTPKDLIGTAFYAHTSRLLAGIARLLGREADAAKFQHHWEEGRGAFQREFVSPAGRLVSGTQTAGVLALHFELLPEAARPGAAAAIVADIRRRGGHLSTGFVGSPYLPHVLSAHGQHAAACALLHQTSFPSWLYAVTQGATTIWERWNGWTQDKGFADPGMNSFNHYAYGAVGDWLYSVVAGLGLDPETPGYRHAVIQPRPGGKLTHARATLETLYGPLESRWQIEGGRFTLDVRIPPNTTGEVHLPAPYTQRVEEGGRAAGKAAGVAPLGEGGASFRVGSGEYRFTAERPAE